MNSQRHHHSTTHRRVGVNFRTNPAVARLRLVLVATSLAAGLVSGCTTLVGRPTAPLLAKREEPGVILCLSERVSGGGIRIIGKLNTGIYPITGATIEYRSAAVSDPMPATPDEDGRTLLLSNPRATKVNYRKGAGEVAFTIDGDAARGLRDKVLWYRWIIAYDRGGSTRTESTNIHRTSLEEAGLPRSAGSPGPDASVALPTTRSRR